ncbi:YfiR family protein [Fulvivirga ulvae]|uniref:YfiR family protein n=1 Tax=Fulvivirga ulvae TaxID=2904245 RepID=UPI001F26BE80|nr:YfiR family protein [Fulvivirga ulvae]UII34839.1 YfiR family protein [Fulvivirga ulvae]
MRRIFNIYVLLVIIGMSMSAGTYAQDRPEHELHSMMIYNFLKYVQWPGDQNSGDFVIGVMGDDNVFNTLNAWYGNKTRGDKTFTIKKFTSPSEISGCQLLYIGKSASNQFDEVQARVQDQSTLTVTDKNGLGAKGSCINFKVVDNRLKFELNQAAIQKSNLKISSQLTSMAILI